MDVPHKSAVRILIDLPLGLSFPDPASADSHGPGPYHILSPSSFFSGLSSSFSGQILYYLAFFDSFDDDSHFLLLLLQRPKQLTVRQLFFRFVSFMGLVGEGEHKLGVLFFIHLL